MENRKQRLLQELKQNDAPPSVSETVHAVANSQPEPAAALSGEPNFYAALISHFEKNPQELQEFSSRVVMGMLREMSAGVSRPPRAPLLEFPVPATALATSAAPVTNVARSSHMDVDPPGPVEVRHEGALARGPCSIERLQEATAEYSKQVNNFLKGVKWAPDGAALLSACEDNALRIYDTASYATQAEPQSFHAPPIMSPKTTIQEAETIYDFCWYPFSFASMPGSSVVLSSCRDHPLHLWDAETGSLRATYRAYDQNDEISSAFSVAFSLDGAKYAQYCLFGHSSALAAPNPLSSTEYLVATMG